MKRGLLRKRSVRAEMQLLENRQLLSATLSVVNPLLVFNAVQNSSASPTETVTFTDTGNAPLTLGSGAFSLLADPARPTNDTARFSLLNLSSAPASLSPGQSFSLQINYKANAIVTNSALLDVSTNDPANPVQVVTLHGIGTKGLGGSNQPSLATILQAYNIPTLVGEGPNDSNAATDSIYPNPPDASSQEVPLQRMVKAGPGSVTINVLASFTASGFSKSYVLGTYPVGNPGDLSQLFYTTASQNQTTYVQPQGATSFDPGSSEFGFYFVSNVQTAGRIGYSEDSLNTWDTTNDRKMRFFPMETPNGTVVPNTYIMTSTEWNAPIGYDFTNIVAIVSNIKAGPDAPSAPKLALTNANAVPGSNTIVFNRIGKQNTALGDTVHDTATLTVSDSGNQPLVIGSYSLSPQWQLTSAQTFPLTINPGTSQNLTIKFIANSVPSVPYNETNDHYYPKGGGVYDGSLTLNSNDPTDPKSVTPLAGYFQTQSENSEEPGLQTITNLMFGWGTDINPSPISNLTEGSQTTTPGTASYYGEEVVSPYWEEADTGAPVTVRQLAAFHTQGNTASIYWYPQGHSGSVSKLLTTANDDGQSLFPYALNTTTPAAGTFSSTGIFGFKVDSYFSDDSLNTNTPGGGHHLRFYPIRDASGNLVPNTYLVAMDYGIAPENFDFQDNVYLVSNIRPATVVANIQSPQSTGAPPTPTDFYAAGTTSGVSLEWAPVQDANLKGYDVYRSSSQNGTYTLLNSSLITSTSYLDATAPGGTPEYYKVTAFDSTTNSQSLGAMSHSTSLVTSITVPPAPGNLTATGVAGAVALSWSAVVDPTLEGYNVYSSSSASGPFTLLTSSPISSTSYSDSSAVVGVTTYYQVKAIDAASGLSSSPSSTSGAALAVTGLQSIDIGASIAGSTTVVTPGTGFNVTAGGPGVANNADGFRFIYQSQTGNFDVAVQVTSLTVAGNFSTAGIMARSTLTTTTPDVYISASPVNYRFKYRTTNAGINNVVATGATTFPGAWVRLVRVGNLFTGYSSTDGINWTVVSSITVALPGTVDLGLAVASNITTATTTAQLRNYGNTAISAPTPPPSPGNLTATGIVGAVSLSWSAVADSTLKGYNVYSSSASNGTYTLLTPSPITSTSFIDSTAVVGATTYYQVTAVDGSTGLVSAAATANGTALAVTGLQSLDIGASIAGSTTVVTPGTDFNVTAGGPGVAANSDGFRFIYQTQTGNFDVAVQVQSLTVAGNYSTAGIMARSALTTTSPDVYMSASPVNYRFKYRTSDGGINNVVAAGAISFPSVWVRLTRVGNLFTGYYSSDGKNWTVLSSLSVALPSTVDLGLAVASNNTTSTTTAQLRGYGNTVINTQLPPATPGGLMTTGVQGGVSLAWSAVADATLKGYNVYSSSSATGSFTLLTPTPITSTSFLDSSANVGATTYYRVTAVDASTGLESSPATANAAALVTPVSLTSVDIGASPTGSTSVSGGTYTITAGGPGVTGNADGFRYAYTSQTGNFDVKVQVASITVAGNFATAGIMARSTLDADSANVYISASPVNYRFKDRPTTDAATNIASSGTPAYPNVWVRLQRVGNVFNGYTSSDGSTWTLMSSVTVALATTIDLGLAVASNVTTATTTAVLENLSFA